MKLHEIGERFPNASGAFKIANMDAEELMAMYKTDQSVHRVALKIGVTGETVRRKLLSAGFRLEGSKWTDDEQTRLIEFYKDNSESFSLSKIAEALGRTEQAVALKASELGVTNTRYEKRPWSESSREASSRSQIERFKNESEEAKTQRVNKWKERLRIIGHPRGMLGKKHTEKTKMAVGNFHRGKKRDKESVQKGLNTKIARYGSIAPRIGTHRTWKAAWVDVGGKRFFSRSSWEVKYAKRLEFLKRAGEVLDWEYEAETFWFKVKRGTTNYTPDFKVTLADGRVEFHEVKGWMDKRSLTKIKRMRIYHPSIKLVIRDGKWFAQNKNLL